jgi:hypothetical protein
MRLNDDDITTARIAGLEGAADAEAGEAVDPMERDGGADGSVEDSPDVEGPMDAEAGEPRDPHETDGGADGGF